MREHMLKVLKTINKDEKEFHDALDDLNIIYALEILNNIDTLDDIEDLIDAEEAFGNFKQTALVSGIISSYRVANELGLRALKYDLKDVLYEALLIALEFKQL